MSSLAPPVAAPLPAPSNAGPVATPATSDARFGDTLRETRASPETQARGRAEDGANTSDRTDRNPDIGKQDSARGDTHRDKQPDAKTADQSAGAANPQPIAAALAPLAMATPRPMPAASGKPLPVATASVTSTGGAVAATIMATAPANPMAAAVANTLRSPATVKGAAPDMANTAAHAASANATGMPDAGQTDAPIDSTTGADFSGILQMPLRDAMFRADADHGNDTLTARPGSADFTAQLTQLVGAHAAQPANAPPAPLQLAMQATPEQPQQFVQETAQHIAWLAGKGIDKAEIQLNPRQLGPISIEISSHHDRIDVNFAVQHPQTVHALQQTLPQLHDMLAQQGLNLGQASVGHQAPGQQHATFARHLGGDAGNAEAEAPQAWRPLRVATPGRVDDFA